MSETEQKELFVRGCLLMVVLVLFWLARGKRITIFVSSYFPAVLSLLSVPFSKGGITTFQCNFCRNSKPVCVLE